MKWINFIGHGVYVGSALITLAVVLTFHFLARRTRRRSPLHGRQIGHLPGQQLLKRMDHHNEGIDYGINLMMVALPLVFVVWATLRLDWTTVRFGRLEMIFSALWMVLFGFGFWQYLRHYRRYAQAKDGLLAERVTGMQLNRLVAQDCIVMHDIPADGFNIDHVVIAHRGVYAVETKSFRKPRGSSPEQVQVAYDGTALRFPDFVQKDALIQAERQARWLASELRTALGTDIKVIPALALPGWYITQSQDTWRSAAVKVFTPMGDGCNFLAKGPPVLGDSQRHMIKKVLALRYPRIEA